MFFRDCKAIFPAVAFSLGIALTFQWLPWIAPHLSLKTLAIVAFAIILIWLTPVQKCLTFFLKYSFFFLLLGTLAAMFRVNHIETKPLSFRYYGNVSGQIVKLDKSASEAPRLTLENVRLDDVPKISKLRLSLHGAYRESDLEIGNYVYTTANISPISGPVEPGGYDFRAALWFLGIEAVGYTRHPLLRAPDYDETYQLEIMRDRFRREITNALVEEMGARNGGFAAAILVGDRAELDGKIVEKMRRANLAHLIAISGLHLAIVMGLVFSLVQRTIIFIPSFYAHVHPQRIAAVFAITAGTGYWFISGMGIATSRALIMAALFFGAIYFGRRVLSLRSVTLAALAILILTPEVLFHVGFQMSFAATMTIIIGLRYFQGFLYKRSTIIRWLLGLLLTSFLAGLGTGIVAVYHFHQLPKFGLAANLLAVPMMSFIVLPSLVASGALSVLGLEAFTLKIASLGIDFIVYVGARFGGDENAVWYIPKGSFQAAVLLSIALWFMFYSIKLRIIGIFALIFGMIDWKDTKRPDILVADSARFVGIMDGDMRRYSRATGHSFVYENWQMSDGHAVLDMRPTDPRFDAQDPALIPLKNGWRLYFTTTKKGADILPEHCSKNTIIIAAQRKEAPIGDCLFISQNTTRDIGSIAIYFEGQNARVVTSLEHPPQPWWAVETNN